MRKIRPVDVKTEFDEKIDGSLEVFKWGSEAITDAASNQLSQSRTRLIGLLAEQCFMTAAVAWEVFISELFVCYINKNSSKYTADLKARFEQSIKEKFGDEMANKAVLSLGEHLKKTEVKSSVDPKNYNLVIKDSGKLIEKANAWLSTEYSAKFAALSDADKAAIDAWREIRDYLAHNSVAAWADMQKVLTDAQLSPSLRWRQNARRDIGAYLKTDTSPPAGQSRLQVYLDLMKDIAQRLVT